MIDTKYEYNKNIRCPHCGNATPKNLYEVEEFAFKIRPNNLGNHIQMRPYLCGECGMLFISRKNVNELKDFDVNERLL